MRFISFLKLLNDVITYKKTNKHPNSMAITVRSYVAKWSKRDFNHVITLNRKHIIKKILHSILRSFKYTLSPGPRNSQENGQEQDDEEEDDVEKDDSWRCQYLLFLVARTSRQWPARELEKQLISTPLITPAKLETHVHTTSNPSSTIQGH